MKKAALTTAVLTALVSSPSFAATVYKDDGTELKVGGRVEFRGDFIGSDGAEIDGSMEDASRARLNLKGKTDIGNGLSAFGVYEAEHSGRVIARRSGHPFHRSAGEPDKDKA